MIMRTAITLKRRGSRPGTALGRALRVDLRRAILSPRFILTVVLLLLWLLFNGTFDIFLNKTLFTFGIPYVLNWATTGDFGLGMLNLVIAALPFSASYLADWECGFDRCALGRTGLAAYAQARVIAVALSSFLAFWAAAGIFLAGLSLTGAPHTFPQLTGEYMDLAIQVGPWCYYLVRLTISGLTCAMAGVFSLFVSTLIPNSYVAMLSPLAACNAYGIIMFLVTKIAGDGGIVRLFSLDYIISYQVSSLSGFSFLWAVVFQLTVIVLCGKGFSHRLRKEHGYEAV